MKVNEQVIVSIDENGNMKLVGASGFSDGELQEFFKNLGMELDEISEEIRDDENS